MKGLYQAACWATAGWFPGRTGPGTQWDPEPKTRAREAGFPEKGPGAREDGVRPGSPEKGSGVPGDQGACGADQGGRQGVSPRSVPRAWEEGMPCRVSRRRVPEPQIRG